MIKEQCDLGAIPVGDIEVIAVPEVEITTTGVFLDFASPSAKKADERSSTWL